jgi:hypothetical protein
MGQVHAAQDEAGRRVVVKRLRNTLANDLVMKQRLAGEASMLGKVVHHNVVRILETGVEPEGPYIVMDHAGTPLSAILDRDGLLPPQRAFAIASQLLAGLAAIHDAGVVHADVKASNILVDENDRVMIIDFGLARAGVPSSERTQIVAGTPAYMAPEIIRGAAPTPASDLYAAAIVVYEMITGNTPFSGSDIFTAHLQDPVVPPSLRAPAGTVSTGLDRLMIRALAKRPDERFPTARDLASALDAVAASAWAMTTMEAFIELPTTELKRADVLAAVGKAATATGTATDLDPTRARVDDIIATALDRSGVLVEYDEAHAAIGVLESALQQLTPDIGSDEPITPEVWRIESVLAALYRGLGKHERSRRLAITANKNARRTGNKIAVARTAALLERLGTVRERASPTPILAKGSTRFRAPTLPGAPSRRPAATSSPAAPSRLPRGTKKP